MYFSKYFVQTGKVSCARLICHSKLSISFYWKKRHRGFMYQQAFKETVGKGKYFNEIVEGIKPKKNTYILNLWSIHCTSSSVGIT